MRRQSGTHLELGVRFCCGQTAVDQRPETRILQVVNVRWGSAYKSDTLGTPSGRAWHTSLATELTVGLPPPKVIPYLLDARIQHHPTVEARGILHRHVREKAAPVEDIRRREDGHYRRVDLTVT